MEAATNMKTFYILDYFFIQFILKTGDVYWLLWVVSRGTVYYQSISHTWWKSLGYHRTAIIQTDLLFFLPSFTRIPVLVHHHTYTQLSQLVFHWMRSHSITLTCIESTSLLHHSTLLICISVRIWTQLWLPLCGNIYQYFNGWIVGWWLYYVLNYNQPANMKRFVEPFIMIWNIFISNILGE